MTATNTTETGKPKCRPHRWDVEKWLPLYKDANIEQPFMTCLECGRELRVIDTSPNMRSAIAHAIASRLYEGDKYDGVRDAVISYFNHQLNNGA